MRRARKVADKLLTEVAGCACVAGGALQAYNFICTGEKKYTKWEEVQEETRAGLLPSLHSA